MRLISKRKNEATDSSSAWKRATVISRVLHARDKDAVVASLLVCEMAAYYKSQGKTLAQKMTEIYEKYSYYKNILLNFTFEGESGMEKMGAIMTSLREHAPEEIAGMKVIETADYKKSERVDIISAK